MNKPEDIANILASCVALAAGRPYTHLGDYMRRHWLVEPERDEFGRPTSVGVRVHHILRSDDDRALHDHPAWSISILLAGNYWEVVPERPGQPFADDREHCTTHQRRVGEVVFRQATDRHRIIVPEGHVVTSLFVLGPWEQTWGFYLPGGKVPHTDYHTRA